MRFSLWIVLTRGRKRSQRQNSPRCCRPFEKATKHKICINKLKHRILPGVHRITDRTDRTVWQLAADSQRTTVGLEGLHFGAKSGARPPGFYVG
jgi:hypothetical protein